jgi:Co/Zn/Cd efflux system component
MAVKKASHILLQGVPSNVSLSELRKELEHRREIKNVEKVGLEVIVLLGHDAHLKLRFLQLHVWQLSEQVTIASVHVVVDARTEDSIVVPIVREILATQGIQFSTIEVAKEDKRGKEFRISSLHFSNHGGDWVRAKDWRSKGSTLPDTMEERDTMEILM